MLQNIMKEQGEKVSLNEDEKKSIIAGKRGGRLWKGMTREEKKVHR